MGEGESGTTENEREREGREKAGRERGKKAKARWRGRKRTDVVKIFQFFYAIIGFLRFSCDYRPLAYAGQRGVTEY